MFDSQCSIVAGLLLRILSCPLPQPFLRASQTWFPPTPLPASNSSGLPPRELWLHSSSELGSRDSCRGQGVNRLSIPPRIAFPIQLRLPPFTPQVSCCLCHTPLDTHKPLLSRAANISIVSRSSSLHSFLLPCKEKEESNLSKEKKIHKTGVFSFSFCSSWWVCYPLNLLEWNYLPYRKHSSN